MKKYIASIEAPDDWEPKFGDLSVDFFFRTGTGDRCGHRIVIKQKGGKE